MEIKTKTVFENISVNDAGMGVIITKRKDEVSMTEVNADAAAAAAEIETGLNEE